MSFLIADVGGRGNRISSVCVSALTEGSLWPLTTIWGHLLITGLHQERAYTCLGVSCPKCMGRKYLNGCPPFLGHIMWCLRVKGTMKYRAGWYVNAGSFFSSRKSVHAMAKKTPIHSGAQRLVDFIKFYPTAQGNFFLWRLLYYLSRAVYSPSSDPVKAVISLWVCLSGHVRKVKILFRFTRVLFQKTESDICRLLSLVIDFWCYSSISGW